MPDFGDGLRSDVTEDDENAKGESVHPRHVSPTDDDTRCHAADLVAALMRQELNRPASNMGGRDRLKKAVLDYPFSRQTVIHDPESKMVDYETAVKEHPKILETQRWVGREIERAKRGHISRFVQKHYALSKDIRTKRYVNDPAYSDVIKLDVINANGFGDGAAANLCACTCSSSEAGDTGSTRAHTSTSPCCKCFDVGDDDVVEVKERRYTYCEEQAPNALVQTDELPRVQT